MAHHRGCGGGEPAAPEGLGVFTRRLAGLIAVSGLLAGCAAPSHDRQWGADASLRAGLDRVAAAARSAATDPHVWVPALAAAALQVGHWDQDVSDWAREHTPAFGSTANAREWSDDLRNAATWAHVATALAAESGDAWPMNKARGGLVAGAAVLTTSAVTGTLKSATARRRPNLADRRSFPSGHASGAAVHTWLAGRNLSFVPVRPVLRQGLDAGLHGIALGTGWARVEAGVHYPADVLAGLALGRFLGAWFNDAFLDPRREPQTWTVVIYPRADLDLLAGAL